MGAPQTIDSTLIDYRASQAREVIRNCIGESGIMASAELETRELPGYKGLCWTRDFAMGGIDGLLAVGRQDVAQIHLENIAKDQESNGMNVPTLFYDAGYDLRADKMRLLLEDPLRRGPRYAWKELNKRLGRFSPNNYTPKSTDPVLQFLNAIITYDEITGSSTASARYEMNISHALDTIESRMSNGLYRGLDWRDNIGLSKKSALLSNNSVLYRIYDKLGHSDKASKLKSRMQEEFWRGTYHTDHEFTDHFDAFGQALAVLYGVADQSQYEDIALKFQRMSGQSDFGIKINDREFSSQNWWNRRKNSRVNHYGAIWPWTTGYVILALNKMGETQMAIDAFSQWTEKLEGFREWYNPVTGEGRGAKNFMASAALYLRVGQELGFIRKAA